MTQWHNRSAIIKQDVNPYRRPKERSPEIGQYDRHLTNFGEGAKKFTIGEKKPESPNRNPGPGYYEPEKASSIVHSKSISAVIKEPTLKMNLGKESYPSPGQYDKHLKPFASDLKNINMGSKYEFKVNDVPPPGFYSPDKGESMLKSRSQSALITKPQLVQDNRHSYLQRETGPDTVYQKHDEFGSKLGPMTIGGKYITNYD